MSNYQYNCNIKTNYELVNSALSALNSGVTCKSIMYQINNDRTTNNITKSETNAVLYSMEKCKIIKIDSNYSPPLWYQTSFDPNIFSAYHIKKILTILNNSSEKAYGYTAKCITDKINEFYPKLGIQKKNVNRIISSMYELRLLAKVSKSSTLPLWNLLLKQTKQISPTKKILVNNNNIKINNNTPNNSPNDAVNYYNHFKSTETTATNIFNSIQTFVNEVTKKKYIVFVDLDNISQKKEELCNVNGKLYGFKNNIPNTNYSNWYPQMEIISATHNVRDAADIHLIFKAALIVNELLQQQQQNQYDIYIISRDQIFFTLKEIIEGYGFNVYVLPDVAGQSFQ